MTGDSGTQKSRISHFVTGARLGVSFGMFFVLTPAMWLIEGTRFEDAFFNRLTRSLCWVSGMHYWADEEDEYGVEPVCLHCGKRREA